jgi:hypothetical protein
MMRDRRWIVLGGRCVAAAAVTLFASVGSVGPASAEAVSLTGICPFPISHEFPSVHVSGRGVPEQAPFDGVDTGQVKVKVTNLDTGQFVITQANSATFWIDDHHLILRGQTVWFRETAVGFIPAGVTIVNGVTRVTLDDQGVAVAVDGGVVRGDICAQLS